jgi:[ribosomal protein S5]-alanine N-acetyltransferase
MHTLTTPLCTLEPQLAAHAAEMFQVLADPAIYEFENAPPESEAKLRERFTKLETRRSADGSQQWLNWVIRLPGGALAGYVQASVLPSGTSYVAYELASRHWRQGIGSSAVGAVLQELSAHYATRTFVAVLKARNFRSRGLLAKLGFRPATPQETQAHGAEPDEIVMLKP